MKMRISIPHTDDICVEVFAEVMKKKLAKKRAEGSSGWQHCEPAQLVRMLLDHVQKGDPVDVANFAMFLGSIRISRRKLKKAFREGLDRWAFTSIDLKVRRE